MGNQHTTLTELLVIILILTLSGCDTTGSDGGSGSWLIPGSEVRDGGPGSGWNPFGR